MRAVAAWTAQTLCFWGILNSAPVQAETGEHDTRSNEADTYDYIIVGAGISGLVVANRLTEDRKRYFNDKLQAIVPYYANELDTSVLISPVSAPNAKLNNSTSEVAVAAVVGGGSVVNGMGYNRGSRADYDAWEALGNPGWSWNGLLPYFRKSTTFDPPTADAAAQWNITWDSSAYRNGPLRTHIPSFQYPDIAAFWDAFRSETGVSTLPGANTGVGTGAFWTPSTIDARDMTRSTARKAYYDPVNATRPNLHLLTGQTATEIIFGSGNPLVAKGVRITSRVDGDARNVYAKKEVILAAGAVQTPQLLQVSGIGPASVLQAAGIAVKRDMPSVGANFQDHATALMIFGLSNQSFPNPDTITSNATYNATVWDEYLTNKTGPIAAASATSILYFSRPQLDSPAGAAAMVGRLLAQNAAQYLPGVYSTSAALLRGFQAQRDILAKQFKTSSAAIVAHPLRGNGFTPAPLLKPLSRGTITLNPADPHGLPIVQFNTLMNPVDAENVIAIVKRVRRFWQNPELAHLSPVEFAPGLQFQTDEEILAALTGNQLIFWPSLAHPAGTCAMMPERLGGCVAPDLKVYGVKGLRIVDASVFPLIPGAALQATVYAVAEKAADLIRGR
ncbi:hypothetical protein B0T14DRAFT_433981 [Immersiella caudata]|uniref:Glucose-methanol-choline oxidoreductase N-terminal domain-containing protein n=1 Tax=Immersiella caudata TaxID=314043 RepID=A0AA40BWS2_9PEZI|nr:hypothetical protein B0T14DRAFT_433981 [Immersiella caudata]